MGRLIAISGSEIRDRVGDVVFVHGLDGDPRATWEVDRPSRLFWPEWLGADLADAGIWSLDYDAASLAWKGPAMPLIDRATNVLDLFENSRIGSKPVVFIAHSLGGLLVKQILGNAREYNNSVWQSVATNIRGIVFFGTPHAGSEKADWVQALAEFLRPNVTINDLVSHSPQLRDLNIWFRNNASRMGIATRVYSETRKFKGLCIVVDQTSADPGMAGVVPIPIDSDHVGICKIETREDQRYQGILEFIRNRLIIALHGAPTGLTDQDSRTAGLGIQSQASLVGSTTKPYYGRGPRLVPEASRKVITLRTLLSITWQHLTDM